MVLPHLGTRVDAVREWGTNIPTRRASPRRVSVRPSTVDDMTPRYPGVSLRLTADEYDRLSDAAARERLTLSDYVRGRLADVLNPQEVTS